MLNIFILFISGIISAAVLDFIWIGTVFGSFYKNEIGSLGRMVNGEFSPNPIPVIAIYILMATGMLVFVLPKVGDGGALKALAFGALWGLILGGVYELTNYSMLANWSGRLVALDMFWTALSGGITAVILFAISKAL